MPTITPDVEELQEPTPDPVDGVERGGPWIKQHSGRGKGKWFVAMTKGCLVAHVELQGIGFSFVGCSTA